VASNNIYFCGEMDSNGTCMRQPDSKTRWGTACEGWTKLFGGFCFGENPTIREATPLDMHMRHAEESVEGYAVTTIQCVTAL